MTVNAPEQSASFEFNLVDVSPELLTKWLTPGEAVVIDVREDFEHAEERINGAVLHPLSKFDPAAIRENYPNQRIVFHCRSGGRSKQAATKFAAFLANTESGATAADDSVFHLAGGIEGWKSAGQAVIQSAAGPKLPIMRQVQIVAGFLIALGVALGVFISPWFLILPAFVGSGLMFAGLSGWCGMAKLLAVMPWNRLADGK